ncbi:hypothetical protein DESC_700254 [Desulfosarcina cetonica]|nr:hypothetical protein DESC_700254 [Desulfosarcina cetonica]
MILKKQIALPLTRQGNHYQSMGKRYL